MGPSHCKLGHLQESTSPNKNIEGIMSLVLCLFFSQQKGDFGSRNGVSSEAKLVKKYGRVWEPKQQHKGDGGKGLIPITVFPFMTLLVTILSDQSVAARSF